MWASHGRLPAVRVGDGQVGDLLISRARLGVVAA